MVAKLIVLDLAYDGIGLSATGHIVSMAGDQFLVKRHPLDKTPKGFQPVSREDVVVASHPLGSQGVRGTSGMVWVMSQPEPGRRTAKRVTV